MSYQLLKLCNKDTILAGGALRSYYTGKEPNDYDFFFTNPEAKELLENKLINIGGRVAFRCPLGELVTIKLDDVKVQLVSIRYYIDKIDLINSFDFTICMAANDGNFYYSQDFLNDIDKKELIINRCEYPVATINRLYKYKAYGYNIQNALKDVIERVRVHDSNIVSYSIYYVD